MYTLHVYTNLFCYLFIDVRIINMLLHFEYSTDFISYSKTMK